MNAQTPCLPLPRLPRLAAALAHLPSDASAEVLAALDAVTRPMCPREIEHALRDAGFSNRERKLLASALKSLPLIAVGGQ